MLEICVKFAAEYNITNHPKKTVYIKFGSPFAKDGRVLLRGCLIQREDQVTHLCNFVTMNHYTNNDCDLKKCISSARSFSRLNPWNLESYHFYCLTS